MDCREGILPKLNATYLQILLAVQPTEKEKKENKKEGEKEI